MTDHGPVLLRDQLLQHGLNFRRIRLFGEAKTLGKSRYVRVDNNAFIDVEGIAEDDIRGFASHPVKFSQRFHRRRDFAAMSGDKRGATALDAFRLVAEKTDASDIVFEVSQRRFGVIFGGRILFKQLRSNDIDLFISALR